MSITAAAYARTRAEVVGLFGWDADSLAPSQTLRVDCATALRLALDDLQGKLIRGESIDTAKMLSASEALSRLLPPAVLAAPPSEPRSDPREALLELILQMRERDGIPDQGFDERDAEIAALKAEIAGLVVPHTRAAITPSEGDVTPPGEIADRDPGMRPGPDDRRPVTIEGKATPAPAADDGVDLRAGFDDGQPEPWRAFATDVDGFPLSGRGRKYWGPV
jgi:hypothetical protein